jgi:hypothetical protein
MKLQTVERVLALLQGGYEPQAVRIFVPCHKSPFFIEMQLSLVLKCEPVISLIS